MNQVLPFKGPAPRTKSAPRVLYVGPSADELCNILVNHMGRVEIAYEQEVQAAFAHLRRTQFDIVIIDTPALSVGEDAAMIAVRTGAALAVARSAQTKVAEFTDLVQGLMNTGVNVVGSVLNEVPSMKVKK